MFRLKKNYKLKLYLSSTFGPNYLIETSNFGTTVKTWALFWVPIGQHFFNYLNFQVLVINYLVFLFLDIFHL